MIFYDLLNLCNYYLYMQSKVFFAPPALYASHHRFLSFNSAQLLLAFSEQSALGTFSSLFPQASLHCCCLLVSSPGLGVDCIFTDFVCQAFFSWGSTSLAVTFASYKLLPWDSLLRVRCLAASGLQTQEPEVPKLYFAYLGSVKPPSSSAAAFCRPIRRRTRGWLSFYRTAELKLRLESDCKTDFCAGMHATCDWEVMLWNADIRSSVVSCTSHATHY